MYGAIIGDMIGSIYEWHNIHTKYFPLIDEKCHFTDDTVMTIATADALMEGGTRDDFLVFYHCWGRLYSYVGYGHRFKAWLRSDNYKPINSYGNGSAMRVSPIADLSLPFFEKQVLAQWSADVTHNHIEGIRGAVCTVDIIDMIRTYKEADISDEDAKEFIRKRVQNAYKYDMSKNLDLIRPNFKFDSTCQGTVPIALQCYLESTSFEDAIRNAISLGGDSDTLAAITGSFAEARYGAPEELKRWAYSKLDDRMRKVVDEFEKYCERRD